jgi:hypothetical protein
MGGILQACIGILFVPCKHRLFFLPTLNIALFVCFVVYLTTLFSDSKLLASDEGVISELWIVKDVEGSSRGLILRYYPEIYLQGLKKTTKTLSQDSRYTGRGYRSLPPEYEVGMPTSGPWCSERVPCLCETQLMRFQVLVVMSMNMVVFWDVTPAVWQ